MQLMALIHWQDNIEIAIFLQSGVGSNDCPLLLVWMLVDVQTLSPSTCNSNILHYCDYVRYDSWGYHYLLIKLILLY